MSVQIKSLSNGSAVRDDSQQAPDDSTFNVIPTANEVYILYTAPAPTAADPTIPRKAAIVKSIRVTNILAQTVNISLYLNRPNDDGLYRRRSLLPKPMSIQAGTTHIDDSEITLEPGHSIQAECNMPNAVHYVISGVERDET